MPHPQGDCNGPGLADISLLMVTKCCAQHAPPAELGHVMIGRAVRATKRFYDRRPQPLDLGAEVVSFLGDVRPDFPLGKKHVALADELSSCCHKLCRYFFASHMVP
jgi:hypothetical protein